MAASSIQQWYKNKENLTLLKASRIKYSDCYSAKDTK